MLWDLTGPRDRVAHPFNHHLRRRAYPGQPACGPKRFTIVATHRGEPMSRRGGHVFIAGASYPCRLCGGSIPPEEPILCVPFAPMPKWEPMTNFGPKVTVYECPCQS